VRGIAIKQSYTRSFSLSHTHKHTYTQTISLPHTHKLSLSLTHTNTDTHSDLHKQRVCVGKHASAAFTHSCTHSHISLTLWVSLSWSALLPCVYHCFSIALSCSALVCVCVYVCVSVHTLSVCVPLSVCVACNTYKLHTLPFQHVFVTRQTMIGGRLTHKRF
jgi:hypothetical protein